MGRQDGPSIMESKFVCFRRKQDGHGKETILTVNIIKNFIKKNINTPPLVLYIFNTNFKKKLKSILLTTYPTPTQIFNAILPPFKIKTFLTFTEN